MEIKRVTMHASAGIQAGVTLCVGKRFQNVFAESPNFAESPATSLERDIVNSIVLLAGMKLYTLSSIPHANLKKHEAHGGILCTFIS